MAKTPFSLSDEPKNGGIPGEFHITVRDLELKNGAGLIVVYLGDNATL